MVEESERLGIEIRGFYDGVAVWVYPNGIIQNRFRGAGSNLERKIDEWIEKFAPAIRREHGLEDPDAV